MTHSTQELSGYQLECLGSEPTMKPDIKGNLYEPQLVFTNRLDPSTNPSQTPAMLRDSQKHLRLEISYQNLEMTSKAWEILVPYLYSQQSLPIVDRCYG
ncbi:hypothetical protein VNO77_15555 [Canavalia gladiata]|uniref:Uncharacterized protein n=1 Tax=Canavalia gladiata TaxID=3824 RepID=A0AAN9LZM5_CANGL